MSARQHEEGENQFGQRTKADVQQTPESGADTLGDLLGRAPDPVGQDCDGRGSGQENPERGSADEIFQSRRDGHDKKECERYREPPHRCQALSHDVKAGQRARNRNHDGDEDLRILSRLAGAQRKKPAINGLTSIPGLPMANRRLVAE